MYIVDFDTQVSTRSRGESFLPQNCNMHCLCTQGIAKIDPEKLKNHLDILMMRKFCTMRSLIS